MESIVGIVYFGGVLGIVVLVCALPLVSIAWRLPFPTTRQFAVLAIAVISVTTYVALMGYTLIPARFFIDEPLRGTNDSFWEMHGDELMYAEQYPPSDAYRQRVEFQVANDRRWYLKTYLSATATAFLLGSVVLRLVHWRNGRAYVRAIQS